MGTASAHDNVTEGADLLTVLFDLLTDLQHFGFRLGHESLGGGFSFPPDACRLLVRFNGDLCGACDGAIDIGICLSLACSAGFIGLSLAPSDGVRRFQPRVPGPDT